MDLELRNRWVLITGGSKGIGLACARSFLDEGARVAIASRDPANLETAREALAAGDRVQVFAADLRQPEQALAMVEAVEAVAPIDVLVTSAGAARRTPFEELDAAAWHAAMQAKFFSYIHVIDPVVKRMASRGRGAIVNVVGVGGKVASDIHLAGGSANAALMLATAGLAHAYAPQGLRINAVNPAGTLTERLQEGVRAQARQSGLTEDEVLRRQTANLPMGRMAEPREIAQAVLFLASPKASYINGAIVSMDGAATPIVV